MTFAALPLYIRQPHFFANPAIDAIRTACVIAGILLIAWIARVVAEERRRHRLGAGQLERFVALGLAALSVTYTEVIVQGTPMTWRLPINILVLAFGFVGIHRLRREQKKR